MANGVALTSGFSQTLTRDYDKVMMNEYKRWPALYSMVAKQSTWDRNSIKKGEMSGFKSFPIKTEGQAVSYENFKQGNEKEVTFTTYAMGFQISMEQRDDDLTGNFKKVAEELGKAAQYTKELKFWDILNSGFGTTRTGIDGKALFADDHPLIDGGSTTIDNQATAGALSYTTLQTAIEHYDALVDERGVPIPAHGKKLLIVPKGLRLTAKNLVKAELKPGSMDNDINVLKDENIVYMMVPFLTSTTAWFLLDVDMHDLQLISRMPLQRKAWVDPDTGNYSYAAYMRFVTTFWNYRGSYGNAGA